MTTELIENRKYFSKFEGKEFILKDLINKIENKIYKFRNKNLKFENIPIFDIFYPHYPFIRTSDSVYEGEEGFEDKIVETIQIIFGEDDNILFIEYEILEEAEEIEDIPYQKVKVFKVWY